MRHAPAAEHLDRPLPAAEVALDAALRLAGGNPRQNLGVESLEVDADRVDAGVADLLEHGQIVGRLELDLDRQAGGFLDRRRAPADVQGATVAAVDRARWSG